MTWTAKLLFTLLATIGFTPVGTQLAEQIELSAVEAEIVAESKALFDSAGLKLPADLVASFHDDPTACEGNLGLSSHENGVARVRVCWTHESPGVEARLQLQALVHELAHAWADENLDDASRDAFVEFSGAETWNRVASNWEDRGTERAADLLTWALLDPTVLFIDFEELGCERWAPAFELLTDTPAPPHLSDAC